MEALGENPVDGSPAPITKFDDAQRRKVVKDAARGLKFLHTSNYIVDEIVCKDICHRDMHPGNVMVLWNGSAAQLIDFGTATKKV